MVQAVAQSHKPLDALRSGRVQRRPAHQAVLPVVDLSVHNGIAVVFDIRVCGNAARKRLVIAELRQFRRLIGAADVLHRVVKLIGKLQPFDGLYGEILSAVLGALGGLPSQNHLRMLHKVAVDGKAVLIPPQMYPVRFNLDGTVPLLQEDDIRDNIRARIGFEGVIGKTDCAQQLCPLCDVPADFRGLLIHGIAAGDEGDHAAGAHLIQRLGKEIVMNGKTEPVVSPVIDLILSERHVADGDVIEIPSVGGFKSCHGNVRFGIKLLCNPPGNAVQLYAVEPAVLHGFGQTAEEVPDAHAGLQNIARFKAHVFQRLIYGMNDGGTGIVGVQRGGSCRLVFLRCEKLLQFRIFRAPVFLLRVKGVCQTTPAHIPGEHFLLIGASLKSFGFQLFQQPDGADVCLILGLGTACTQVRIRDAEVLGVPVGLRPVFFVHRLFCRTGVGKCLPFAADLYGNRICIDSIIWADLRFGRRMLRLRAQPFCNDVIGKSGLLAGVNCLGLGSHLRLFKCFLAIQPVGVFLRLLL